MPLTTFVHVSRSQKLAPAWLAGVLDIVSESLTLFRRACGLVRVVLLVRMQPFEIPRGC